MNSSADSYDQALTRAAEHARSWLATVHSRPVGPRATADHLETAFGGPLPDGGTPAAAVIDRMASLAEPGLMAIGSGRFFGWVMGGTLPAGLGADWLVSAWDQNAGMRAPTPAVAAMEEVAAQGLLELLRLPETADVGFVTGATAGAVARYCGCRSAISPPMRRRPASGRDCPPGTVGDLLVGDLLMSLHVLFRGVNAAGPGRRAISCGTVER